MKCHYEVLGVARNATHNELKKAYRRLALKWHPDKNLDNLEEAKEQFQLVQQAWETLSDPHERAWYDDHREVILKGGLGENYKDDSIDLFQYFTSTCFKGYGDDEKGFYTVYRTVFETLAAEDSEFAKDQDSDEEIPGFGDSQSSYEEVVHNFYAYWQSYSTKRSFAWLDPYDIKDAANRRVVRLIEKENKKIRDKGKRERNEQVRNLVAFVRKRDKRVQAHAMKLADRAKENLKKAEEWKKQQLLERQKELKEHKISEWSKFSNIEAELKNIEANLAREFGENLSSDGDTDDEDVLDDNSLYCVACNKIFKTRKAFTNHENSRRHKDNIAAMKASILKEEKFESSQDSDISSDTTSESEKKLATDSQMPDFLLNPLQRSYNQVDAKEEASEEELISDNEGGDDSSNVKGRKNYPEGTVLATKPEMDDAIYVPPKVADNDNEYLTSEDELISDQEDEKVQQPKKQKKKKKRKKNIQNPLAEQTSDEEDGSIDEDMLLSKKQRKRRQQRKAVINKVVETSRQACNNETEEVEEQMKKERNEAGARTAHVETNDDINGKVRNKKLKNARKLHKSTEKESRTRNKKDSEVSDLSHCCAMCKSEFPSKNKLFEHLQKTGHYQRVHFLVQ